MVTPATEPANLVQHRSERCGRGGRDVCQEDAWLGGPEELEQWGGTPGSQWGLPFLFPLQHSNLQVQFAIAEEKLRLSLALQR